MERPQRYDAIDLAKGLAIIAIALGHVLRGLVAADVLAGSGAASRLDTVLYTFHLSVFALLAGLFVQRSVMRRGARDYVVDRLSTFLYLYVVWSLAQGAIKIVTASLVNSPTSLLDLVNLAKPDAQFWFLPFLCAMTVLAVLVEPWRDRTRATIAIVCGTIVSIATWGLDGQLIGTQGWSLTVFFMLGSTLGPSQYAVTLTRLSRRDLALTIVGSVTVLWFCSASGIPPTTGGTQRSFLAVSAGIAGSLAGTIATVLSAELLRRSPVKTSWLSFLGQRSLEIFLAHIIAAAGARILLLQLGVTNVAVHVSVGLIAALLLPLCLWHLSRKLRFPYLFERPFRRTSARAS